ncbi:MAG TPA: hypothetical protein DCM54_18030 [Gammaproteobacteria bacterium]|nr:hypothetical protein [Gammaproteobacteria bacterium]|tara:strand:+ start:1331 stop:1900 length:570 start_codon:yes stop_codon:yes gene_type:complete
MKKSILAAIILTVAFIVTAAIKQNQEFLFYSLTLVVLVSLVFILDKRFNFSAVGLWGFDAWMVLHLAGGLATVGGVSLYALLLLPIVGEPYHILKYDQLVHVYCYVVIAILAYEVLAGLLTESSALAIASLTVLLAMGIGALNEVVEFMAVVAVGSTGVGDYMNNAIDLVANLLGGILGAAYCVMRQRH